MQAAYNQLKDKVRQLQLDIQQRKAQQKTQDAFIKQLETDY